MKNMLQYKNYCGTVKYSNEDNILYGEVLGINSLISYEGTSIDELKADFEAAVDDYLELCKERKIAPEKQYKGSLNVRLDPDTHRKAMILAQSSHISLNQFIESAVREKVQSTTI